MKIKLNGREIHTEVKTLKEFLHTERFDIGAVATAIDGNFVPRSEYPHRQLAEGMKLEVLGPMQGG